MKRYLPTRPLPSYAFLPGRTPRPSVHVPESNAHEKLTEQSWFGHAQYLWGVDLYNADLVWEAHEAWESLWRESLHGSSPRLFLQGLIQCAAASVKSALGDGAAVLRISARALDRLRRVQHQEGPNYLGVDLPSFIIAFECFAKTQPLVFAARPQLVLDSNP
ncbi:MAG: hypothetical protein RL701_7204 [Pseudomonadota bacterium]